MHREREEQRLMPYFITGACLVAYLVLAVSAPSLHDWWHRHHAHGPLCVHPQDLPTTERIWRETSLTREASSEQSPARLATATRFDEPPAISGACLFCQFAAMDQSHLLGEQPRLCCGPHVLELCNLETRCPHDRVQQERVRGPPAIAV